MHNAILPSFCPSNWLDSTITYHLKESLYLRSLCPILLCLFMCVMCVCIDELLRYLLLLLLHIFLHSLYNAGANDVIIIIRVVVFLFCFVTIVSCCVVTLIYTPLLCYNKLSLNTLIMFLLYTCKKGEKYNGRTL